ncbi:MAG: hypothetical protein A2X94_07245 [Bdellovibrionales bacterium GWB1_55_8]|nr:MAG: hypothetical protein A2X94_07245 [Bdellovibrionales bacterium GWB1_55_8]
MSTVLSKSIAKIYTVAIALILASLALSGCGNSPQASVSPAGVSQQPPNTQVPPAPPAGQLPNSDLYQIPATTTSALLGTYSGTLVKQAPDGQLSEQPFSIVLRTVSLSAQQPPYAVAHFNSVGALGSFAFDSYLNIGLAGFPANGVTAYGFSTAAQNIPELLDTPFTLHLILSLRNGQFDPTQSAIFIKDCGFSQGAACSNFAQDVWFGSDLGKQSL